MRTIKSIAVVATMSVLAGCGGGGGSSGGTTSTPPPAAASPGGIWTGTDSATGLQLTALISETGQMEVIRSDRAQFFGNLTVSGNSISATIDGDAAFGTTFPDGSIHGTGTVSGTLSARSSLQATVKFTTDSGESSTTTAALTFQSVYLNAPNVANFAGTYTDSVTGVVVTINSAGIIFAQDPTSGCVVNGQINVVSGAYSLYAAIVDYANCQGADATLNAYQFAGFVALNGADVLAGLLDKSGKHYGLVYSLSQ